MSSSDKFARSGPTFPSSSRTVTSADEDVIGLPPLGALNIHASRYRRSAAPAPIQAAIRDGHTEKGVTIMHMVKALDAGPILLQARTPVPADGTTASSNSGSPNGRDGPDQALALIDRTGDGNATGRHARDLREEVGREQTRVVGRRRRRSSRASFARSTRRAFTQCRAANQAVRRLAPHRRPTAGRVMGIDDQGCGRLRPVPFASPWCRALLRATA
jgi:methionyl-tRNA formyltransferase